VVSNGMGFIQTVISDGKSEIEFDNMTGQDARKSPAPPTIFEVNSMQMQHPMFCGTLLYQFFGGASNLENLADASKGAITFGPEEKASTGEMARNVKFYGTQQYGHVEILIGEKSLFVHRIRYDNEPLVKMMSDPETTKNILKMASSAMKGQKESKTSKAMDDAMKDIKLPAITSIKSEELYSGIKVPTTISAATFKVEAPKGTTLVEVAPMRMPSTKPPISLGSMAPDFTVTGLDGKTIKLTSLRGHPVMIDFWATWCGPCVASLPHTQEIFKEGSRQGLQVMAISNEDNATVSKFIKENNYSFPTFTDDPKDTGPKYKLDAIPTTVVIDSAGKLVAYIVGGGQDAAIKAALTKVGIKL